METSPPPHPAFDLAKPLYYQLVYTLTNLLPPPIDDTPPALRARNRAAIAKVAALLPVNANEADLAPHCIAARAQAEDILRLLRQHAGDIGLVMRLNTQYTSMVRTSLAVHASLMRVQALRHKREAIETAANQDAWTQHVAERSMLTVVDPDAVSSQPAWPKAAPVAARPEPPPTRVDQRTKDSVSETTTNSQDAASETSLSEQPRNGMSNASGETDLRDFVSERLAISRAAGRELPASSHERPGRADQDCHVDGETASI